jgi:hypothetical protein
LPKILSFYSLSPAGREGQGEGGQEESFGNAYTAFGEKLDNKDPKKKEAGNLSIANPS